MHPGGGGAQSSDFITGEGKREMGTQSREGQALSGGRREGSSFHPNRNFLMRERRRIKGAYERCMGTLKLVIEFFVGTNQVRDTQPLECNRQQSPAVHAAYTPETALHVRASPTKYTHELELSARAAVRV